MRDQQLAGEQMKHIERATLVVSREADVSVLHLLQQSPCCCFFSLHISKNISLSNISLLDNWIILDKWPSSTLFIEEPCCDSGNCSSFVEVSDFFSQNSSHLTHTRFQLQLSSFLGPNTPDANLLPRSELGIKREGSGNSTEISTDSLF